MLTRPTPNRHDLEMGDAFEEIEDRGSRSIRQTRLQSCFGHLRTRLPQQDDPHELASRVPREQ